MKDYLNDPQVLIDTLYQNNHDEHVLFALEKTIVILASTLDSILMHVDSGVLRKGTLEALDKAIKV
jgi:hypothetical protein